MFSSCIRHSIPTLQLGKDGHIEGKSVPPFAAVHGSPGRSCLSHCQPRADQKQYFLDLEPASSSWSLHQQHVCSKSVATCYNLKNSSVLSMVCLLFIKNRGAVVGDKAWMHRQATSWNGWATSLGCPRCFPAPSQLHNPLIQSETCLCLMRWWCWGWIGWDKLIFHALCSYYSTTPQQGWFRAETGSDGHASHQEEMRRLLLNLLAPHSNILPLKFGSLELSELDF